MKKVAIGIAVASIVVGTTVYATDINVQATSSRSQRIFQTGMAPGNQENPYVRVNLSEANIKSQNPREAITNHSGVPLKTYFIDNGPYKGTYFVMPDGTYIMKQK